ncbi:MAG: 23S rRNA (guanine745-N1)-methyltransferase [Motiliproteus sp.]|jgi:23S rRNA (guanine745-N1)-methyltransferase
MTLAASLCCPLCQHSLTELDNSARCSSGHCFDRAKQGYYNLLPVQQKRSRDPGDDVLMVAGRREFLDQHHYQPLSDAISSLLLSHLEPSPRPLQILDCGCGEGYYTDRLEAELQRREQEHQLIGIDISKHAVRAACTRSQDIAWIVASGTKLPVTAASQDALLCLFAPISHNTFHQALRPGGLLLLATTGCDHLLELRQQIYPQVRRNAYDPLPDLNTLFEPIEQQQVQYRFNLTDNRSILQLLAMTPHQWRTDASARQRLQQLEQLELRVDINLHLLRARENIDSSSCSV